MRARLSDGGLGLGEEGAESQAAAVARARERWRVVAEAARAFAEVTTDYERLLDGIARVLSERIRDTCAVYLLTPSGDALQTVSLHATPPSAADAIRRMFATEPIELADHPLMRRTVETGEPLLVPRLDDSLPRGRASAEQVAARAEVGLHSFLLVPLRAHQRCIGVLGLGRYEPASPPFDEADLLLAQTLADHASLAIQNARLYANLEQARRAAEHAEERARSSEQAHRAFFEASPIPTFLFELESGRILESNPAALALYGYTRDEFLTRTLDDLRRPEERSQLRGAMLAAGEGVVQGAGWHRRKDGTDLFVEGRTHTIWFEGRKVRFAVVQDQTERLSAEAARHEVEARLQRTLDMMMEGYTILGHDLRYLYVNEVGARQARLPKEKLLGRTPMELYPDFERTGMYALLTRCLRERAPVRMEEALTLADGSAAYFEVNIRPIPEGLVILSIDATERHRTEEAREALEEQLRQSQRMDAVGRLAGGVAHDFNNLLAVILGYGETLLDDLGPSDPRRVDVQEMHKAASRAAELTKQLLMFSRQQLVEPKVLDVNDVLASMEKMLRRIVGEHIELDLSCSAELGRVLADRGNIEQVIMNLVVNARDAMPRGGRLAIQTENVSVDDVFARAHLGAEPGRYVRLTVTDTGIGMDRATKQRIFEPFYTTKEHGKGTGLGLSTVFGIVKQCRGGVWVHSEPGVGTSFQIYLPETREQPKLLPPPAPAQVRGDETILLCEDEEGVRSVARRILERYGYRVLVASDPSGALQLADTHGPEIDLLLTDVVMPQMSGAALAERVTSRWPHIEVLYVSGYTDGTALAHGVPEHGVAFLQKPFTSAQLTRKVRAVFSRPPEAPDS